MSIGYALVFFNSESQRLVTFQRRGINDTNSNSHLLNHNTRMIVWFTLTITNHSGILSVVRVTLSLLIMTAVSNSGFVTIAFYIVQQNGSSTTDVISHGHGFTTGISQLLACHCNIIIFPPDETPISTRKKQQQQQQMYNPKWRNQK